MKSNNDIRLPKAVFQQCRWIVKDIDRLYSLDAMRRHEKRNDEIIFFDDPDSPPIKQEVLDEAAWKVSCIKAALMRVPDEYRMYILESIADGSMPITIAHENTWKKYRRLFIKELAFKLNLI